MPSLCLRIREIHAVFQVGWQCSVDLLGVRQVQVCHDFDEFVLALCESGVEGLLLPNGAGGPALVVMARVHPCVIGQREQLAMNVVVQCSGIACWKFWRGGGERLQAGRHSRSAGSQCMECVLGVRHTSTQRLLAGVVCLMTCLAQHTPPAQTPQDRAAGPAHSHIQEWNVQKHVRVWQKNRFLVMKARLDLQPLMALTTLAGYKKENRNTYPAGSLSCRKSG